MSDVGPGTLIADRYAVSHRLQQHPRWERWAAHDTMLGRDIVLLTFPGGTPAASAAIDAGRRVAGLSEPRLVRVLDVVPEAHGASGPAVGVIVEEGVDRARTLTRILEQGGLPADEARRILGEASSALTAAATRGLRHVVLTPRNVLLLPDGSIRVRGVAIEAALLGLEDTPATVASRLDARALVSIGYAALTGRWPLTGADSGLPPAPLVGGVVVAPDELAADVCPDLDRLARMTLVEGSGPRTAAEVLAGLRPWPHGPTIDLWSDRRGGTDMPRIGGAGEMAVDDARALGANAGGASGNTAGGNTAGGTAATGPAAAATASAGATANAGATASAGATATAANSLTQRARGLGSALSSALGAAGAAAGDAAARLTERARHTGAAKPQPPAQGAESTPVESPHAASTPRTGPAAAGQRPVRPEPRTPGATAPPVRPPSWGYVESSIDSVLASPTTPLEDPVPLVPVSGEIGRDESRLALAIVAGLVVLLAVLGLWGLPKLSGGGSGSAATVTAPVAAKPSASATVTGAESAPLSPVAIIGAAAFDPGTGQVASTSAARAYDGKADTMWRSGWYSTSKFGGLKLTGVGLILDLGQQTQVRQVTVSAPAAQDITVYVANKASLEGATAIGTSTGRSGSLVFEVPAGPVASGQLVIVFVTTLGPDGSGKYRAQVSEVQVSK